MKKVFISYSDMDRNKMRALEKALKASGISPIIIADRRSSMELLTDKVKTGIISCNCFVPIITRNSIKTQWVNQEIGFATAQKVKFMPIVEREFLNALKGFVHKQADLPYTFSGHKKDPRKESQTFRRCYSILIEDLLEKSKPIDGGPTMSDIFHGTWMNEITLAGQKYVEKFKVIGNRYVLLNSDFEFVIEDFSYDPVIETVTFTKVDESRGLTIKNTLQLLSPTHIVGQESNGARVKYTRIPRIRATASR